MDDNSARPDQFVVALPHLGLVYKELTGLPVIVEDEKQDDRLGLALVTFRVAGSGPSLVDVIDQLELGEHTAKVLGKDRDPKECDDLELVLAILRARFIRDYAGWVPTVGKNRTGSVDGFPHVSFGVTAGASNYPVWADPPPAAEGAAGHDVRVGILDTAMYAHPAMTGKYFASSDALLPQTWNEPLTHWSGHSTFIAGIIARQAAAVEMHVRHVLDSDARADAWDVARQIARFAGSGMDILNLSFGCFTEDGQPPLLMARAIELVGPDTVLVVAAGNHGRPGQMPRPTWPAAFEDVVAVGANDGDGNPADFSPEAPWVTIGAPGVDVRSMYLFGAVHIPDEPKPERFDGWAKWSGTSFAAAAVSGAIAARTRPGRRSARDALEELSSGRVPGISAYRFA